jgi:hypothetical protein
LTPGAARQTKIWLAHSEKKEKNCGIFKINFRTSTMDKLQLTGQNLGRVFNYKSDCMSAMHLFCYEAKQLNLKLKIRPKHLLGSHPLAFKLPASTTHYRGHYRKRYQGLFP